MPSSYSSSPLSLPTLISLLLLSLLPFTLSVTIITPTTFPSNLLLNGDFQLGIPTPGALPNWTVSSPPDQTGALYSSLFLGQCYNSTWCLNIGSRINSSSVTQQVAPVTGIAVGQYNLSFYLLKNASTDGGNYTEFSASVLFPLPTPPVTFLDLTSPSRFDWQFYQFSFNVSAVQSSLTVNFTGRDDSCCTSYHVDGVVLNQISSIPSIGHQTTPPVGSVSGDPQFIGLRGQSYQVHGMDQEVYNLISHPTLQLNSQFHFLSHGECPTYTIGQLSALRRNCWSHPGSYISQVGLMVKSPTQPTVHVKLVSGGRRQGFTAVLVDNAPLRVQGSYEADEAELTVSYAHSHIVIVQTALFRFVFYNSDFFINQETTPTTSLDAVALTGLLGSTSQGPYNNSELKWVEGRVDDYLIQERELFGVDFMYNLYQVDRPDEVAAVAQVRAGRGDEGEVTGSNAGLVEEEVVQWTSPAKKAIDIVV